MKSLLWIVAGAFTVCAQPDAGSVTAPVLGTVFDAAAGKLRPLSGIPASAMLGDPLDSAATLSAALPAPGQDYAIGVDADSGAAVLITAGGRILLAGVKPSAARLAMSPRGRAAAFYFAESASVQIVGGLPGNPQVVREVQLGGTPTALAVSDDAAVLLASIAQDADEAVTIDQAGAGTRLLQRASHVAAIEFFPDSRNALFAESAGNAVWLVQGATVSAFARDSDGIADVVDLAGSNDGATAFIAMRSGQIAIRDVASGTQTSIACACEPSGLARLRGKAVFRLNGIGAGSLWILDADSEQPRIVFVAAAPRSDR